MSQIECPFCECACPPESNFCPSCGKKLRVTARDEHVSASGGAPDSRKRAGDTQRLEPAPQVLTQESPPAIDQQESLQVVFWGRRIVLYLLWPACWLFFLSSVNSLRVSLLPYFGPLSPAIIMTSYALLLFYGFVWITKKSRGHLDAEGVSAEQHKE